MNKRTTRYSIDSGFTLVELMVTLVVAFLVIGAVYASYKVQQRSHIAQLQVTEIQQNIRAAIHTLSRDLRIAGYDPHYTAFYGLTAANQTTISFGADLCEEADPPNQPNAASSPITACGASSPYAGQLIPEQYTYTYFNTTDPNFPGQIRRNIDGTPNGDLLAENIERFDIRYTLNNGVTLPLLPAAQYENVKSVQISILARSSEPDYNYTDQNIYTYAGGLIWDPSTFASATCNNNNCLNYRRRLLVETVELRNIGI